MYVRERHHDHALRLRSPHHHIATSPHLGRETPMPHQLPALPYDFGALEPHIDTQTMQIHHGKHHQTYVTNLNAALDKHPELHNQNLDDLMKTISSVPDDIKAAVRNNGGGHWNHSLFWKLMAPNAGGRSEERRVGKECRSRWS